MALVVTLDSAMPYLSLGNLRGILGTMAFDSSYPTNGEDITAAQLGLSRIDDLRVYPSNGYAFTFDKTNLKVLAYRTGATAFTGTAKKTPVIVEEVVTVASNTGTLANAPAYIVAVDVTAGTVTGAFRIIPTGETPLTKQVAVTFTSGVMTFLGTDAVTSVRVTYIPQMAGTPFAATNMVIDESVTAAAAKTELANRAFAVQYVWDNTDNVLCVPEPVGEAPTATHNVVIDITNGSSKTDLDSHADDEGNTLKVTYLKHSGLDNAVLAINDADVTLSGADPEQYDFNNEGLYEGLVIPGLGVHCVGETAAAANVAYAWSGPSISVANALPTWHPHLNTVRTQDTTALATLAMPWFILNPTFIGDETPAGTNAAAAMAEVGNGVDLLAITAARFEAIGV